MITLTGSNNLKQCSTASFPSLFNDKRDRSSITLHSTRFTSLGKHSLFANSNKFRHFVADIAGISSVYK